METGSGGRHAQPEPPLTRKLYPLGKEGEWLRKEQFSIPPMEHYHPTDILPVERVPVRARAGIIDPARPAGTGKREAHRKKEGGQGERGNAKRNRNPSRRNRFETAALRTGVGKDQPAT